MTVVVATRELMVADTLCCHGNVRSTSHKIHRISHNEIVGVAGDFSSGLKFVEWYRTKEPADFSDLSFDALVLNESGLFHYDNNLIPMPIMEPFYAIGSGADFAIAALDLGKSPVDAVKLACKWDISCGLPYQIKVLYDR